MGRILERGLRCSNRYTTTNLYNAYLKARKHKRYRSEVLKFSYALEENLIQIQNELIWRTYTVGPYRPFIVYEPKKRQIVALPFKDRVVQHAVNNVIEPIFDKRMIYDSYACRKGKGTHRAARRLAFFLGKQNIHYFLKADIASYFASINHSILKDLIREQIEDTEMLWLIDTIINHSNGPGLPIGNLTSQLFANVYLHELDCWMKNEIGVNYYLRYMDDFVVLHKSKKYLLELLKETEAFLSSHLALQLNPKTRIDCIKNGIEFVGYRVWNRNKLIKKQSLKRMKKRVKAWKEGIISSQKLLSSFSSWVGHCADTASHKAVERLMLSCLHTAVEKHEKAD